MSVLNNMSQADLVALVEKMQAEKLAEKKAQAVNSMKISEKGGLSVYGLGRFPITLYRSQWTKLLAMAGDIQAFIDANASYLKEKAPKAE